MKTESVSYLNKTFAEKYLDGFLEDGQKTPVMDANTFNEKRQHTFNLRQRFVLCRETFDRVFEHLFYHLLIRGWLDDGR